MAKARKPTTASPTTPNILVLILMLFIPVIPGASLRLGSRQCGGGANVDHVLRRKDAIDVEQQLDLSAGLADAQQVVGIHVDAERRRRVDVLVGDVGDLGDAVDDQSNLGALGAYDDNARFHSR